MGNVTDVKRMIAFWYFMSWVHLVESARKFQHLDHPRSVVKYNLRQFIVLLRSCTTQSKATTAYPPIEVQMRKTLRNRTDMQAAQELSKQR